MSVASEFIDFIVPIKTIEEKYPGGWVQCLEDYAYAIGGRVWYDEHLFRDGAMNPMDIESLVNEWQALGFHTHNEDEDGNPNEWVDVCVYQGMLGGATLECDWIMQDPVHHGVCLKGTEPGEFISRENFKKSEEEK